MSWVVHWGYPHDCLLPPHSDGEEGDVWICDICACMWLLERPFYGEWKWRALTAIPSVRLEVRDAD